MPKPVVVADACGRALRRSLPVVAGAGILCAIAGTAWAGYQFVTTSPRFAIKNVEVNGNRRVSHEQIVRSLHIQPGDNVFMTDLEAVVADIRRNPWIAAVEARRVLPHSVEIEVREHEPSAIVQLGELYLVDSYGHPFKRLEISVDDAVGLPIITGLNRAAYLANPEGSAAAVRNALAALRQWRTERDRPSIGEVHLGAHGALTLITYEQAISIQLGSPWLESARRKPQAAEAELSFLMQTFDATWTELTPGERARARAIHLDARPDHVTVALAKDS